MYSGFRIPSPESPAGLSTSRTIKAGSSTYLLIRKKLALLPVGDIALSRYKYSLSSRDAETIV